MGYKKNLGSIYLIVDNTGIKIGASKDKNVDTRTKSVCRNRGTGTCKVEHIRRGIDNYFFAEKKIRYLVTVKLNLPISINEWHNFENPKDITEDLIKNIIKLIDSYDDGILYD